jgi:hypothetical protein
MLLRRILLSVATLFAFATAADIFWSEKATRAALAKCGTQPACGQEVVHAYILHSYDLVTAASVIFVLCLCFCLCAWYSKFKALQGYCLRHWLSALHRKARSPTGAAKPAHNGVEEAGRQRQLRCIPCLLPRLTSTTLRWRRGSGSENLKTVFPNLKNIPTANLRFMK